MKILNFCLAALCLAWLPAHAAHNCSVDVEGQPGKKFSPDRIVVPAACESFTVRLVHVGHNSKMKAGHNWVLTRPQETDAIMRDGIQAGAENDWLKPGDTRVLAKTPMLGGQETATVTFPVAALTAGQPYTYFCSFPAHAAQMRGTLVVGD
ncbi:azurin [Bordetella trematum]|uniref:azurin n=1 Tax=Bordetella trematum TaxID=123899 RepID=UPI003AF3D6F9